MMHTKESANCRMEAKYANDLAKRGRVKIIFLMVDATYHTRSQPDYVDGWLGFMVGDALWYPLWDLGHIEPTLEQISKVLGNNARSTLKMNCKSTNEKVVDVSPKLTLVKPPLPVKVRGDW